MGLNINALLCEEHEMEKEFFKRDHCLRDYRLFNSEECAYNHELESIRLFDVPVVKEIMPEYTKEQFLRKVWIDLAKKDVRSRKMRGADRRLLLFYLCSSVAYRKFEMLHPKI